jgi:O-antigen/teichoic acid export membrane protein
VSRVRHNLAANALATAFAIAAMVAAVPFIVSSLGVGLYGLVGLHAAVLGSLAILDLGLGATINRESARLSALGDHFAIERMIRNYSLIYWWIAAGILIVGAGVGPAIALLVLTPADGTTRSDIVVAAIGIATATAAGWPATCYRSGLQGLERQSAAAGAGAAAVAVRSLGAAALVHVWPSITAYFVAQTAAGLLETLATRHFLRRALPPSQQRPRFDRRELLSRGGFSLAMTAFVAVGLLLQQVDRLVLAGLATLDVLGVYALAWLAASLLVRLAAPLVTAVYPRITHFVAKDRPDEAIDAVRIAGAVVFAVLGPAAIVLGLYATELLRAWGQPAEAVEGAAPLVPWLAAAALSLAAIQIVHAWAFARGSVLPYVVVNGVALLALAAAVPFAYGRLGATGVAATTSIAFCTAFVAAAILAFRGAGRTLVRSALLDCLAPLAAAAAVVAVARSTVAISEDRLVGLLQIVLVGTLSLGAATLAAPRLRPFVRDALRRVR